VVTSGVQSAGRWQRLFVHSPVRGRLQPRRLCAVRVVRPCAISVSDFKLLLNGRFENQVMSFLRHQTVPKHLGICLKEGEFPVSHTLRKIKGAFL